MKVVHCIWAFFIRRSRVQTRFCRIEGSFKNSDRINTINWQTDDGLVSISCHCTGNRWRSLSQSNNGDKSETRTGSTSVYRIHRSDTRQKDARLNSVTTAASGFLMDSICGNGNGGVCGDERVTSNLICKFIQQQLNRRIVTWQEYADCRSAWVNWSISVFTEPLMCNMEPPSTSAAAVVFA